MSCKASAGTWCCLILLTLLLSDNALAETDSNATYCEEITVVKTWWHKSLEGVYRLMPVDGYNCAGRNVYRKADVFGEHFLYFVGGGWKGWMVGSLYCVNKGFLSVGSTAEYPEEIARMWEEYDSFRWQYNDEMIVNCSDYVLYRAPKFKTTTTPPASNDTNNVTTTVGGSGPTEAPTTVTMAPRGSTNVQGVVAGPRTDTDTSQHFLVVIYVVVPCGCFAILVLVIIVLMLYLKKQPVLDPKKFKNPVPSVHYIVDRNDLIVEDDLAEVSRDPSLFGDSPAGESRVRGEGEYDYLEQCITGTTGAAMASSRPSSLRGAPPEYTQIDNKFGSWKGRNQFK